MTDLVARDIMTADPVTVDRFIEQSGWTDGLPVVPPTEELVGAMLQATRHRPVPGIHACRQVDEKCDAADPCCSGLNCIAGSCAPPGPK